MLLTIFIFQIQLLWKPNSVLIRTPSTILLSLPSTVLPTGVPEVRAALLGGRGPVLLPEPVPAGRPVRPAAERLLADRVQHQHRLPLRKPERQ